MQLRDYQSEAIDAIYAYFAERKGEAPLVVAPTGSGKSLIQAAFMQRADADFPGTRILLATHQKELIEQNYKTLLRLWPSAPAGIYSAGLGRRQARARMLFGGVQSIHRKAREIGHVDLMLVDEAHMLPRDAETQYGRLIASLREINPAMKIIGLTATPYRMSSGLLHRGEGAIFDGIAYDIPVGMLVQRGYLSPLVSKRPGAVFDLRGLHTRAGDFIEKEMLDRFGTDDVTEAAVSETVTVGRGEGRRAWLAFCISVEHALQVRDAFRRHGVSCEAVFDGCGDRDAVLREFKAGRVQCVTNVNILTTGFDYPGIDLLAFLRPTQSCGLYVQMAGRGMRITAGKENCRVLDFAGNVATHGPIDGLAPPAENGAGKGDSEAPTKVCPDCEEILLIAARECPCCGFEFPEPEPKIERTASTEAIMNLTAEDHWEPVRDVSYTRHRKAGAPDSLRVEYLVGARAVSEWVCLEHSGYARQKAVTWWQTWGTGAPPDDVGEALARLGEVQRPTEAVLMREGKYYRVAKLRGEQVREDAA